MSGTSMNALAGGVAIPDAEPAKPTKDSKRLAEAAKGFEALMITQMMKSARESSGGGWLSDGDETGEDQATAMAEQQFAQAMANSGGLGLAKMVVRTMSKPESSSAIIGGVGSAH
jgi:Rod binding domain-containing protein